MKNTDMDTAIQSLLSAASKYISKATGADSSKPDLNLVTLCGVAHYETIITQIFAEFLNPKGKHGFGSQFLDAFLDISLTRNCVDKEFRNAFSASTAIVRAEDPIKDDEEHGESGRLDIAIYDRSHRSRRMIIIENKINAEDGYNQLSKYAKYAQNKCPNNWRLLYLTPDGRDASEQSAGSTKYIAISYRDHILPWLDKCVDIANGDCIIREFLSQFASHIKEHITNNTMNKELVEELSENADKIAAAGEIAKAVDAARKAAIKKFVNRLAEPCNLVVLGELDLDLRATAGFNLVDDIENIKINIGFEFEEKDYTFLFCGVCCSDVELSDAQKDELKKFVCANASDGWKTDEAWPIWKYIGKRENNYSPLPDVCRKDGEQKSETEEEAIKTIETLKGLLSQK